MRFRLGLLGAVWALSACAHAPAVCTNPPPFYVALRSGEHLNPSAAGQALTTQVQVFQLRATTRLENADFDQLWSKPNEVLGDELIEKNELSLDPASTLTVGFARDSRATAVAVVALFRQPIGTTWRAVMPLQPADPERCTAPRPVAQAPAPGDDVLGFSLDQYRVAANAAPRATSTK